MSADRGAALGPFTAGGGVPESAAAVGLALGPGVRLWLSWRDHQRFDDEWRTLATDVKEVNVFDEEERRDA